MGQDLGLEDEIPARQLGRQCVDVIARQFTLFRMRYACVCQRPTRSMLKNEKHVALNMKSPVDLWKIIG